MDDTRFQIELRYIFNDEQAHSINAIVHNDCEKYLVESIKRLCEILGTDLEIDAVPSETGSFKAIYWLKKLETPITYILLTALSSSFFSSSFRPLPSKAEETYLVTETAKNISALVELGLTKDQFDELVATDKRQKALRNFFYNSAAKEKRIKKIEFSGHSTDHTTRIPTVAVNAKDFCNQVEPVIDDIDITEEELRLYIISPVLTQDSRAKWRGYYDGGNVNFEMRDKKFLEKVYAKKITFSNGSFINCLLITKITTDYNLGKETTKNIVEEVYECGRDSSITHLRSREQRKMQMTIDFSDHKE